jgi:hypothetical protein
MLRATPRPEQRRQPFAKRYGQDFQLRATWALLFTNVEDFDFFTRSRNHMGIADLLIVLLFCVETG